jgi:hypothetical protein
MADVRAVPANSLWFKRNTPEIDPKSRPKTGWPPVYPRKTRTKRILAAQMDFCPHERNYLPHEAGNGPHGSKFARTEGIMAARINFRPHGTGQAPHESVTRVWEAIFARTNGIPPARDAFSSARCVRRLAPSRFPDQSAFAAMSRWNCATSVPKAPEDSHTKGQSPLLTLCIDRVRGFGKNASLPRKLRIQYPGAM